MKTYFNKLKKNCQKHDYLFLMVSTIIYELIIYLCKNNPIIISVASILFVLFIILFLFDENNIPKNIFYTTYIVGIILRTIYILSTDIYSRQHDVETLEGSGHLKYIYILYTTLKLPTTTEWQFYHPPFWHIVAASWLKLNSLLKIDFNTALEGIQIITLLLTSYIIIITDKICYKFNLKTIYRLLIDIIITLQPTLIVLSASINNDCLLTFFDFLIIYYLIIWYENSSWKNTIILAVITGLCVMTKANGAIMAAPILYIFIVKLLAIIKTKKQEIKLFIIKILSFAFISLPLGLWFQIRNIIIFKSISSIPSPGLTEITNPLSSRFLTVSLKELLNYTHGEIYSSLPSQIIRTSIIGEYSFTTDQNVQNIITIIIICNLVLITISILLIIKYLFQKRKSIYMNILIITWLASIISMYIFNYKYPYICSADFRYIVVCLLPGNIIIAYYLNNTKKKYLNIPIILLYLIIFITIIIFFIKVISIF